MKVKNLVSNVFLLILLISYADCKHTKKGRTHRIIHESKSNTEVAKTSEQKTLSEIRDVKESSLAHSKQNSTSDFEEVEIINKLPESIIDDVQTINSKSRDSTFQYVGGNKYKLNGVIFENPHIYNEIIHNSETNSRKPFLPDQVWSQTEKSKNGLKYENVVYIPEKYDVRNTNIKAGPPRGPVNQAAPQVMNQQGYTSHMIKPITQYHSSSQDMPVPDPFHKLDRIALVNYQDKQTRKDPLLIMNNNHPQYESGLQNSQPFSPDVVFPDNHKFNGNFEYPELRNPTPIVKAGSQLDAQQQYKVMQQKNWGDLKIEANELKHAEGPNYFTKKSVTSPILMAASASDNFQKKQYSKNFATKESSEKSILNELQNSIQNIDALSDEARFAQKIQRFKQISSKIIHKKKTKK